MESGDAMHAHAPAAVSCHDPDVWKSVQRVYTALCGIHHRSYDIIRYTRETVIQQQQQQKYDECGTAVLLYTPTLCAVLTLQWTPINITYHTYM